MGKGCLPAAGWITAVLVVFTAIGGPTAEAAPLEHQVTIERGGFNPREDAIRQGDTVVWTHADPGGFHSVTADGGFFDSHPRCGKEATDACMKEGERYRVHFLSPGGFPYHCKVHGETGVIEVVAADEDGGG